MTAPEPTHLVALGDLSSLRPEIGEEHAFSQFELPPEEVEAFKTKTENWCTFYGRDRGEKDTEFKVGSNFCGVLGTMLQLGRRVLLYHA